MKNYLPKFQLIIAATIFIMAFLSFGCKNQTGEDVDHSGKYTEVEDSIKQIIDNEPGKFGVAVIVNNADTIAINNTADYPMMSMFKFHEALAVCHALELKHTTIDSIITINRDELDPDTWSPMLKDYNESVFSVSIKDLLNYILVDSDNNASNLLFDRIVSPKETDAYIRVIEKSGDFRIMHSEHDMKRDISKSYDNSCSPLSYASLVNKVFTDSVINSSNQEFIKSAMGECNTGMNRISAGLPKDGGVNFAHRTGSGYINSRGEIIAINDGGYVQLPSGTGYSIAVFVRDFGGRQEDADKIIARISAAVYNAVALSDNLVDRENQATD